MHIVITKFKAASGKIYERVLLRESYRDGKKVKKRTVANLTNCSPDEVAAIKLALKHKGSLSDLSAQKAPTIKEGLSFGGVWTVFQIAKRLGIVDALGSDRQGQLALWQVIARVLEQGSRLSAVRLARSYAIAATIGLKGGFNEDDLYGNLSWLCQNQASIEDRLFNAKGEERHSNLFLYDVTSSYLEGDKNELGDWGYNRDKKKGKKQIVVGLLTRDDGTPVTTEVFRGNTQDTATFASQVAKAKERFGCEKVTFVGDRGMIKSGQIGGLAEHGFHYITALTKPQIETLIKADIIQYSLFDTMLVEVQNVGGRYILRRNPERAKEIQSSRIAKQAAIERLIAKQNAYLKEHPKAQAKVALKTVEAKIERLGLNGWLTVSGEGRFFSISIDTVALAEISRLDGCYAIKTDLPSSHGNVQDIHDRYKDLKFVESAFRAFKSELEIRPIYVRAEESTRGHVLVVMLSYMIIRELDRLWSSLYLTVDEGLRSLSTLTILEVSYDDERTFQRISAPREQNRLMLEAAGICLPEILPMNHANVVTRTKRRRSAIQK